MEEVYRLNKTSWFVNPWFDIILLTGFPYVLIVIYLLNYLHSHFPSIFFVAHFHWFARFVLLHFFVTFGTVYLDRQEWKEKPIQFLWAPLFLIMAMIIFSVLLNFNLLITIFFYSFILHSLFQNYYILQVHKLRNQDYLRCDNIIDNITLLLAPVYFCLKSIPDQKFKFGPGTLHSFSINLYFLDYLRILAWLSIAVFIARQIYLFIKRKRTNIFKNSMILMTILSFYFSLMLVKNIPIFIMAVFRCQHTIQYIMWVWFYHRKKFKDGIIKEVRLLSYLTRPRHFGLYILFIVLFSIVIYLPTQYISSFLTINRIFPILFIFPVIHVYFDVFIWGVYRVHGIVNT